MPQAQQRDQLPSYVRERALAPTQVVPAGQRPSGRTAAVFLAAARGTTRTPGEQQGR